MVGVVITVLGCRVAYILHRWWKRQDRRTRSTDRPARQPRGQRRCQQCGKPWRRGFLEYQGRYYCSLTCRIGYLRDTQLSSHQAATEIFAADGTPVKRDLYAAPAPEISAAEARVLLESEQGYVYLDVRSPREFESGHPAGAVNVPIYHRRPDGLVPNHAFLQGVAAYFRQDARLLVGGGNGNRAELATGGLLAAGYTSVTPVRGGYAGVRDLLGRTVAPGWRQLGLPVEQGPSSDPGSPP
jgi:rhodanese-related sulfurtransferase